MAAIQQLKFNESVYEDKMDLSQNFHSDQEISKFYQELVNEKQKGQSRDEQQENDHELNVDDSQDIEDEGQIDYYMEE